LQAFKCDLKLKRIQVRGRVVHDHHIGNIHESHAA
jgi:hypothetical protein